MVAEEAPIGVGLPAKVIAECASPNVADNWVPLNAPAPVPSLVKIDAAQQPSSYGSRCNASFLKASCKRLSVVLEIKTSEVWLHDEVPLYLPRRHSGHLHGRPPLRHNAVGAGLRKPSTHWLAQL